MKSVKDTLKLWQVNVNTYAYIYGLFITFPQKSIFIHIEVKNTHLTL